MRSILVIRGGAIGDFILTLPALKLLRNGFPDARIEILGYKHIIALAENRFYAQATRSIEYGPLASFFSNQSELPAELADYFASFDLVISTFSTLTIFSKRTSGVVVWPISSSPIRKLMETNTAHVILPDLSSS